MAKKREDPKKGIAPAADLDCDLDKGYTSPIRAVRDLSLQNIRDVLIKSRYLQILLSLTIVGLLLRFFNLGFNSVWLDEASTYTFAIKSLPEIWQATNAGEFNPPLFYWIEHCMLVFGNNEVVLRFVPALLGVLTIPLVYCVGKEFMDRNVGIIAAAAVAFSPFLIFYSQEARAYSMMFFFVAFALVFYLKALKDDDIWSWALFGLLSALAFWSHFYALVIIGALVLYALAFKVIQYRKDVKKLIPMVAGWFVFGIVCLPLILITLQLFSSRTSGEPTFGLQGLRVIIITFQQVAGLSEIALYILLVFFVIGVIQAFILDKWKGIFLVMLTVLTFAISYILSFKMPMVPRYLIFFTIVFFLGIAVSYKLFQKFADPRLIVYGFVAFLIVLNAFVLIDMNYYSGYTKDDWRGFSSQLQQMTNPGDHVIVAPGYIVQPLSYYYSNSTDRTYQDGVYTAKDLEKIASMKPNGSTTYYVVTGDISSADPEGDVLAWLKNNSRFVGQRTGIYLFTSA